ncbi:MAG: Na+/H+ antiporter subunit E [Thermoplasmata archaeon]|nr:Na+/H+ antiporter subunit E [Thermoplasmata archaeon]
METASKGSRFAYAFIIYLIIWCIFIYSPGIDLRHFIQEFSVGIVFSLIAAGLSYEHLSMRGLKNLSPRRIWWAIKYVPVFIWAMIKANIDVAYRVLHPARPIKPGIVRIRTSLKNPVGKLALANSITLTPGTMTMQIVKDRYYIHWIYVRSEDEEEAGKDIKGNFEKYLKEVFD